MAPPSGYTYGHLRAPAKSKKTFYATSPDWSDVTPIPLLEHGPPDQNPALGGTDPGNALATIAYSPRYLEAMSYVRGLMAVEEWSERVLALSEDVIGMSPSHYTIWVWRMKCLRWLWGVDRDEHEDADHHDNIEKVREVVEVEGEEWEAEADADATPLNKEERVKQGVERELNWLEATSERNLKNYQIWHHRQSLLTTYPRSLITASFLHEREIPFVTHILSFDAKNYHVWTYRQWLCRQFPEYLLPPSPQVTGRTEGSNSEIESMEVLIGEDIRNNSAWAHRYFVVFGFEELWVMEGKPVRGDGEEEEEEEEEAAAAAGGESGSRQKTEKRPSLMTRHELFADIKASRGSGILKADKTIVQREIAYAKDKINLAPQNPSSWNYLKGVLKRAGIPLSEERVWCEGFVRRTPVDQSVDDNDNVDEDGELDFLGEQVRSSHAIDWLAEIYAEIGQKELARSCLDSLANKWDPIRRNYWHYRQRLMDNGQYAGT